MYVVYPMFSKRYKKIEVPQGPQPPEVENVSSKNYNLCLISLFTILANCFLGTPLANRSAWANKKC